MLSQTQVNQRTNTRSPEIQKLRQILEDESGGAESGSAGNQMRRIVVWREGSAGGRPIKRLTTEKVTSKSSVGPDHTSGRIAAKVKWSSGIDCVITAPLQQQVEQHPESSVGSAGACLVPPQQRSREDTSVKVDSWEGAARCFPRASGQINWHAKKLPIAAIAPAGNRMTTPIL